MDFQALLKGVDCACGKHHRCDMDFVAVEPDAIRHLTTLCKDYKAILLVADENTFAAAGKQTMAYLAGKQVDKVIFPGDKVLIPNENAIERVQKDLSGHDLIIGIGSGVIQDLCKYVAFYAELPYFVVATAPSMDGYASSGAAMITGGMKVTYSAKVPSAILADTAVLKDAPFEMIQAGYGDIVGKYSALNDWKLSRAVNGEYFCQYIYDMTMDALLQTLQLAPGLVNRDEKSVQVLMEALVLVGIAMSFAGSSRPASGGEHHLSHFFEIVGIVRDEPYFPHGIDVAYSAVVTAQLRQKLLAKPFPAKRHKPADYAAQMQRVYGPVAEGCMELQKKVGFYEKPLMDAYKANEAEIREILAEMPTPEALEKMLGAVGLSMEDFYKLYSHKKIADAVTYGKDLKDRYTVLWLYNDLYGGEEKSYPGTVFSGWWPEGHIQGIALDKEKGHMYFSFTTILLKTDLQGKPLGSVKNLAGHLGCITFDPDRRKIYGSLELKHDAIGAGVIARTGWDPNPEDNFYLVSFDVDAIDRMEKDAEKDGIMQAVWLGEVRSDYEATDPVSGNKHRYGCSGFDGTGYGPVFGTDGEKKIMVAYGIYEDNDRDDNDHQVILQYDPSIFEAYGQPLNQEKPHYSGPEAAEQRYYLYTGNTRYGMQNLEYDPHSRTWLAAVYRGKKEKFTDFVLFFIDATAAAAEQPLLGRDGETGRLLTLAPIGQIGKENIRGSHFPLGSTGVYSFGNGKFYFSRPLKNKENKTFASLTELYEMTPDGTFCRDM